MRYLGRLAAVVAACAASCTMAPAVASEIDRQTFCAGTAQTVINVMIHGARSVPLDVVMEQAQREVLADEALTDKQRAAILRAVSFGWHSPEGADPQVVARWQFVGCLATEV